MAVKSAVLRVIVDNSRGIGSIFGCTGVVAINTIIIPVVNVDTIFLVILRYDIGSAVVVIIIIGRMMSEIMVMLITIIVKYHCPCFLACLGR